MRTKISARDDKVNPQHAAHLRATSAEENLLAFLVNNPDKLKIIEKKLSADDFVTDFNRKLYIYFSERIKQGKDPMTAASADFTADELSQIIRIVNTYSAVNATPGALDEYIAIIREESARPSEQDIRAASTDDIAAYLSRLRDEKK